MRDVFNISIRFSVDMCLYMYLDAAKIFHNDIIIDYLPFPLLFSLEALSCLVAISDTMLQQ